MSDEEDLLAKLKKKIIPVTDNTTDTGLMATLRRNIAKPTSTLTLDITNNTGKTLYDEELLKRFKQALEPKGAAPDPTSSLETSILSRMANSDNPAVVAAKLFVTIQSKAQTKARREKEEQDLSDYRTKEAKATQQAILDHEYAQLKVEMGVINDFDLMNLAFDELVASYDKLSDQKKAYIIARIEEVYPSAIQKGWLKKRLISTEYITKLCDSDDKKMELILGLSIYP
jgi:hypothetical protein